MKKLIGYVVAVAVLACLPAVAAEKKKEASESSAAAHHASGTISAWDEKTKAITVKNWGGEKTFTLSDATKFVGTPKVGEHVSVEYAKTTEGAISVTEIRTGKQSSSKKS